MSETLFSASLTGLPLPSSIPPLSATSWDALGQELHKVPFDVHVGPADERAEAYLVGKRLGVASSLFFALRARHAPTASHCLRVALSSSCWAATMEMEPDLRDALEIAALLHDVGKVGIPDHILFKPGKLSPDEQLIMGRYRLYTHEIVAACCASPSVLEILAYQGAWYDGSRPGFDRAGEALPLGSRVLTILDAFDSMTSELVYRRALTRERAIAELFDCAGTQFDPTLVEAFARLVHGNLLDYHGNLARRWLKELHPAGIHHLLRDGFDRTTAPSLLPVPEGDVARDFHNYLLDNMHDGVFFVDANLRILHWNRAAERLTGIRAGTMLELTFVPSLLAMRQEDGTCIGDEQCPVAQAIRTGAQRLQRVAIQGRTGNTILVNLHAVPVLGRFGERKGAAVLLHDASSQVTLEERVQLLQERAAQDPLTKVANRAEFDRILPQFIQAHRDNQKPCSLIIADLDHFKRINDIYGHQAGDEALKVFADELRAAATPGDLVARYGGEEFVMLCAGLDAASAMQRAEDIRRKVSTRAVAAMNGQCLTASFGVTELQPGDTPESFLRRADRGLLQAKDAGRNRVVQLGSGYDVEERREERRSWWSRLLSGSAPHVRVVRELVTSVPLPMAAEKLKGFISDHHAEIVEVCGHQVRMRVDGPYVPLLRRHSDRAVPFEIQIELAEMAEPQPVRTSRPRTVVHVEVRPARPRDRRRRDTQERASQILASIKAYLMAEDLNRTVEESLPTTSSPFDLTCVLSAGG